MKPKYIKASGIIYENELKSIHKSSNFMQPVFEAFMNAWDAIAYRFTVEYMTYGHISICFHYECSLFDGKESHDSNETDLSFISVTDNGIGITVKNFDRLFNLRDTSKGASHKGTGRIQYVHYFDYTIFDSVYKEKDKYYKIKLQLSKNPVFLSYNSILRLDLKEETDSHEIGTTVSLHNLLDKKNDLLKYRRLKAVDIKNELLKHYLSLFCENRKNLPQIEISIYFGETLNESVVITSDDISVPDKEEVLNVYYSKIENRKIVDSTKSAKFKLQSFVQPENKLERNSIYFVANGALAKTFAIDSLSNKDCIDGNRYLFLVSGDYFDEIDDDLRGELHLVKEIDFKKQNEGSYFPEECLLVDKISEEVNNTINTIYPEFAEKRNTALLNLDELKNMFLIDEETISRYKKTIKCSDSDEKILSAIYKADMDSTAKRDADIKSLYHKLRNLNPADKGYQTKLDEHVDSFTKLVPLQNRTTLTKYVARRRLVLKVFDMILNRELNNLQNGENINENLLHNLIFKQHSENPSESDLWLLDDQYLYFKGSSEKDFNNFSVDGEKLILEDSQLSPEQLRYKYRKSKDIGNRRPDVLLFPEEGKCIILEFKAPGVNVSLHLSQINRYAMMIRNLSSPKFNIKSFYGYLIGENLDYYSIVENDTFFQHASDLNYIFRPYYQITGMFGRENASLYTEIIKYSDILRRAKNRNRIFLEKLGSDSLEE